MSDTSYSLKQCSNCGAASYMPVAQSFGELPCPSCGVIRTPFLSGAQLQFQAPTRRDSFGPLLTGNVRWDRILGQTGEIAGLALLLYSFVIFYRALFEHISPFFPMLLTVLGNVATAWFLFKHADTMRHRYPSFARGWQAGRDSWGKVVEPIITLLFGVGVLILFSPVCWVLFDSAFRNGPIAWLLFAALAYVLGSLVRRAGKYGKGNTTP